MLPNIKTTPVGVVENFDRVMDMKESDEAYDSIITYALESILDVALEADETVPGKRPKGHIISKEVRDKLPDSAFGIPKHRKYPLVVKGDRNSTTELVSTAVQMFHYANPLWKKELAQNIVKVIQSENLDTKIHPKSQINKFVDVPTENIAADTPDKYHRTK